MKNTRIRECPNCKELTLIDLPCCMSCRYDFKLGKVNQNCITDYLDEINEVLKDVEPEDSNDIDYTDDDKMLCPRCNSLHLTTSQKGYSVSKAAAGFLLIGAVGLLAGGVGKDKIRITCLECGYTFKAGEYQSKLKEEEEIRKSMRNTSPISTALAVIFIIAIVVGFFYLIFSII